ncbi:MAG: VWA domain-containing protein [Pseudomonadota bacterium]
MTLSSELRRVPRLPGTHGGQLADNLMHFARVLREVGVPVGPGAVLRAADAIGAVGLRSRSDLYWTLSACFVSRREHRPLFDQTFHVFWRNPQLLERMMSMMLPQLRVPKSDEADKLNQRLTDALNADAADSRDVPEQEIVEHQSTLTWSDQETLQDMDFETMSQQETRDARRVIEQMDLGMPPQRTRRYRSGKGREIDLRASVRAAARRPDCGIPLVTRQRRTREPAIVALCDISGSMAQYSRMMLHFLHALTRDQQRVHSFVFGTRLTNITRALAQRDVDEALDTVSQQVCDWSGGTRIADSLLRFNRDWSRRVMSQGAVVLLITDGLERDDSALLAVEAARLSRSCQRLIWLNPLLRYDKYQALAQGARALLPHVSDFRSVHNLTALDELAALLASPRGNSMPPRRRAELTVVK